MSTADAAIPADASPAAAVPPTVARPPADVAARTRWATAVAVTVLSIALAEVSIGSSPFGLLNPLQWLLLVPVYGCQVLLIAALLFRVNRAPTLAAVWCAGVIMGLYEFYITHVLWDQPWDDRTNAGLAEWTSLIVVAGFWHAFISMIAPLAVVEHVIARKPVLSGLFPRWISAPPRLLTWIGLVLAGVVAGGMYAPHGWRLAPLVLVPSAVVVALAMRWLRRQARVDHLADALPARRGLVVVVAVTAVFFAIFIVLANTTWPVSGERQAFAVACYLFFVGLAAANLQRTSRVVGTGVMSASATPPTFTTPPASPRLVITRAATFIVVATASTVLPGAPAIAIVMIWLGGGAVAIAMFVAAIIGASRGLTAPRPA